MPDYLLIRMSLIVKLIMTITITYGKFKLFPITMLLVGIGMLYSADLEAQCAMCKAVITSAEGGEGAKGSGINKGILYIIGIPYLLIGTVGFFIYRHNKKLKANI